MTVSGVGTSATLMAQQLVNLNTQLNQLTQELSTGQAVTSYAGIPSQAQLLVGLNQQLSAINSFQDSNNAVSARLSIAQTALTQFDSATQTVQQSAMISTYDPGPNGQTVDQTNAASELNQMLSLLNTQADNRYVFSGDAVNQPSVASMSLILNGTSTQAGLLQMISERNQADLGSNGLGRLVIPAPSTAPSSILGTGGTVAPDAPATAVGTNDISSLSTPAAPNNVIEINGDSITIAPGTNAQTLVQDINNQTATTNVTASINASNQLVLTSANASTAVDTTGTSASFATALGLPATPTEPTNLLDGANAGLNLNGQTLTIQVGSNTQLSVTFGTGAGQISTLAGLQTALSGLAGGTATIDTGTGTISVAANNTTDDITIGGTANPLTFGLQTTTASPTSGNQVSVSEDSATSPFGFKIASVSSTLTGANVQGPIGTPPGMTVDLNTNPNPNDTLTINFNLPDGTTQQLVMTATTTSPPATNQFTIGATPAATAANLQSALTSSISTLAQTQLTAASDVEAANNFFDVGSGQAPQRVQGPPYDTSTALVAGTSANTVSWYTGEMSTNPRSSVSALVGPDTTVNYGVQADEPAIANVIANVAVFAAASFSSSNPNSSAAYIALGQRVGLNLNPQPGNGTQTTVDIETDLANAQDTIQTANSQQTQTQTTLQNFVQGITGINNDQVAAEILTLQTQLQASLQTTAMLSKLSIVNYLSPA
jgi:flagellin-like hook-associated protein FlgL